MIVTEKDFTRIEFGTIIWQCYFEKGYPKIGKTFVKGKKIDRQGVHIVSLIKEHGDSRSKKDKSFASKKGALKYYKAQLENIKTVYEKSLANINRDIDHADETFDRMAKESEKTITNKSDDNWMMGIFGEDERQEFNVNPDIIPELKFEVGEKVFTAFSMDTGYMIVEDKIIEVSVNFRDKDKITADYETAYCSKYHMRGESIFKTKEEAEEYCRNHAQSYIDSFNEKMQNIEYKESDGTQEMTTEEFAKAHNL